MSRPRYDWWGYVKGMIRRYPALCRQYWDLHSQSVTALYGPQGGAGDDARKTERLAIRELPATKQREYEAVRLAIEQTRLRLNGDARLRVIDLVLWKNRYTLYGAAQAVHVSVPTVKRWHGEFIRQVAKNYGLMDGEQQYFVGEK